MSSMSSYSSGEDRHRGDGGPVTSGLLGLSVVLGGRSGGALTPCRGRP